MASRLGDYGVFSIFRGSRGVVHNQRRPLHVLVPSFVILLVAGLAFAAQKRQSPSPDLVKQGAQQFQQSCGFCHGADATGGRGPDLVRSALVAHDENGNLIGDVIRQGRPDKGMPALALSNSQIQAIAAFLHNRVNEGIESSGLPKQYPIEKLLTGSADEGKAYFEGAGGCTSCHSPTGDLKGIATKLAPLNLEAQMLYPEHAPPTKATVVLPSGEHIEGTLTHFDEFTVTLRDAAGWQRSFSRDEVMVEMDDPLAAHQKLLVKITPKQMHDLFAYMETLK
jgi:cytochrome c oxidase cbb3-type subunit 3